MHSKENHIMFSPPQMFPVHADFLDLSDKSLCQEDALTNLGLYVLRRSTDYNLFLPLCHNGLLSPT
jgi:hypothetical protein